MGSHPCACHSEDPRAAYDALLQQIRTHRVQLHESSHFSLSIVRCGDCGTAFLQVFMELIDWVDGEDSMANAFVPLRDSEVEQMLLHGLGEDQLLKRNFIRPILYWVAPKRGEPSWFWRDGPLEILPHD